MKLMWRHKKATAAMAVVVAVAAVIIGLRIEGRGGTPTAHQTPPSPSPSRVMPKTASQLYSPYTGEPISKLRKVLAVKIDNIVFSRPQTGLEYADIVYVIPVEGGLSRFMAIFSSRIPRVIGPVRSAREDDLGILRQFGRPAFAFSGAQPQLLPVVEGARIIDLYSNKVGGYYRGTTRIAPYNLYAHGSALAWEGRHASTARDIGFRFGPPPAGSTRISSVSAGYATAIFRFTWSHANHRWYVWMDGSPAMTTDTGQLWAATVVIQHTRVKKSKFQEWGSLPPYAMSIGSGVAQVLRDGRTFRAHWSRPNEEGGTTFTTTTGQPMTFAPGPVWVVLVP